MATYSFSPHQACFHACFMVIGSPWNNAMKHTFEFGVNILRNLISCELYAFIIVSSHHDAWKIWSSISISLVMEKLAWYTADTNHKYVNITITDSLGWVLQSVRPWQQGPYFTPVVPLQTKQAGLWWILRKLGPQIFLWQDATKQGMH